jgi:hypothetical protein
MTLPMNRGISARLFLMFFCIVSLSQAGYAQLALPLTLGCSWPFKTTPDTLNVMYPDSNAIYWTTPYILLPSSRIEITGNFFPARFLSINTYNTLGESLSSAYDLQFVVDKGSQNPFYDPTAPGGSFHATIMPSPVPGTPAPTPPPAGVVYGPHINQYGFSQGYVVIRAYLPTNEVQQGELPKLTISISGHTIATVSPCKQLSSSLRLLLFNAMVRYWNGQINAPGATEPDQLMFRPPMSTQAGGAFPNDFNKYVVTGMTYQKGVIAVVRGRAATVPSLAANGYPLLLNEQPELRYWSMCNYDHVFPFPVVEQSGVASCAADDQTKLDGNGYYTYVIAATNDVPANAKIDSTVTILPWGKTQIAKALIFRNMLPDKSFTMTAQTANDQCSDPQKYPTVELSATCTANYMGPYYPEATYCQKTVYEQGGWQACFQQPMRVSHN